MDVKAYLESRYKTKTVQSYLREWEDFESYLKQLNISVETVDYPLILEYINHLQSRSLKGKSINRKLLVMEQIYRNLLPDNPNPVKSLRVKTSGEVAVLQPLEIELLQQLLNQYPRENYYQKRNYLMLTLIHYQALRVGELKQLKVEDIDLKKATIYIPKNHRSNSRTLELTALQVLEIQDYLAQTRPQLLHYSTNQLFITGGTSENLNNSFLKLKTKLKKRLPQLQNLEHWRSSIIVHWLEHQPLLEVQAKLGHRYASSTERYKIHAIKDLQKELNQHHPLQ